MNITVGMPQVRAVLCGFDIDDVAARYWEWYHIAVYSMRGSGSKYAKAAEHILDDYVIDNTGLDMSLGCPFIVGQYTNDEAVKRFGMSLKELQGARRLLRDMGILSEYSNSPHEPDHLLFKP